VDNLLAIEKTLIRRSATLRCQFSSDQKTDDVMQEDAGTASRPEGLTTLASA
jgi:hypothetical protein